MLEILSVPALAIAGSLVMTLFVKPVMPSLFDTKAWATIE